MGKADAMTEPGAPHHLRRSGCLPPPFMVIGMDVFISHLVHFTYWLASGFLLLVSDGLMAVGYRAERAGYLRSAEAMYLASLAACRMSRRVGAWADRYLDWQG